MVDLIRRAEIEGVPLARAGEPAGQPPSRSGRRRCSRSIRRKSGAAAAPTKPAPLSATPSTARARACTPTSTASRARRFFSRARRASASGRGQPIGIRSDSKFTAPEPELAVVLGSRGTIARLHAGERRLGVGYRARERALPAAVEGVRRLLRAGSGDRHGGRTARSVQPGDDLHHHARRREICTPAASLPAKLHRRLETLIEYLLRANHVPCGTVC